MFEIPDDDDNFWETLPIDDITNFSNAKQPHLKSVSPEGSDKRDLKNDRSVLQPDSHENITLQTKNSLESASPMTPTNFRSNQDSFQSPSFSPLAFSIGRSGSNALGKECSNKTENCNVSRANPQNISLVPTDSVHHERPNMMHICNDSSQIENVVRLVENYNVNNHSQSSSYDPEHNSKTNCAVQTRCIDQSGTSTRDANHSNPVRHLEKQSKRCSEMSPPLDETRPKRSRRKFPGPAGVLPKLRPESKIEEVALVSTNDDIKLPEETIILSSQSGDDVFNDDPWHRLLHDLGADADEILKRFSIVSSLQKAVKKQLPQGKVPLLFAVLESLDFQGTDAGVMLKDKSGKIQGTFHRDLVKEYASCLQAGVAVVLRQVGVISPTLRSHYLNITPNNIVSMYAHRDTDDIKRFPNTSPQTLKELVTVTDTQTQKLASSTPRKNLLVVNNTSEVVNSNNTRSNELLRTPLITNQENRLKLTDCIRSPRRVSAPDVNSMLMPATTQKHDTWSLSDSTKGSSTRSCQLQSSNDTSTPVKKFSFKPSANTTPFKPSGNIPFKPSGNGTPFKPSGNIPFKHSGNNTPFKPSENSTPFKSSENSTPFKPSGNSTPFKQSGNSTPFKPSGNSTPFKPSENSTPFKPSGNTTPFKPSGNSTPFKTSGNSTPFKPSGNSTPFKPGENSTPFKPSGNSTPFKQSGNTPLQMQQGTEVYTNCLETAHSGHTLVKPFSSTMEHCSINKNTQAKHFNSAFKTSSYSPGCSNTDFNSNDTGMKQANVQKPTNTTSSKMFSNQQHQNGCGVKGAESGGASTFKEWDDGDWQSSELDELLSQMSEDM